MPRLDAYIPQGALSEQAEATLLAELTDILLREEGADPNNAAARSIAWVWVHRPAQVYVAGEPASAPRYRFEPNVPEGQMDDRRRQSMVEQITSAVLDAEDGAYERDPMRVWVFPSEIPEGTWGGGGGIVRLADIAGFVLDDEDAGRKHAEERLAKTRA